MHIDGFERPKDKKEKLNQSAIDQPTDAPHNFFPKLRSRVDSQTKRTAMGDFIHKPKKLALKDYLSFKRDIFLSKMNKEIKLESTNKLDDFIFHEEKSLEVQINHMKLDEEKIREYFYELKTTVDK